MSGVDAGPMARLKAVCEDPMTMSVIAQRMADGEGLKVIAKSWQVPYGPLLEWIAEDEERAAKYRRSKAFGAIHEVDEAKEIADSSTPETVAVDKERIRIRQFRASRLARDEYGERAEVKVQVEDNRIPADREQALLETARSLAYVLSAAADAQAAKAGRPRLAASIEVQKEEKNVSDPGII